MRGGFVFVVVEPPQAVPLHILPRIFWTLTIKETNDLSDIFSFCTTSAETETTFNINILNQPAPKMVDTKPLVLFVPGLYSSTLEPAGGSLGCLREKWNPPSSLLLSFLKANGGHAGLKLPITWSKNEEGIFVQDEDDIEAVDCLSFVQDKLLHFLETLHKNDLIELHKVVWDWRRSFEEAESKVASKIESICSKDSRKATVLSHSTGAMLTWPTISRNPEWFSSWVNAAGCLLEGSNLFLADYDHGWSMSFVQMLSKEDYFSFAGLCSYFPVKGELCGGAGETNYIAPDGSYYSQDDFDIYDVATWEEFKIGIFAWKKGGVTAEEREHLKHSLATAKRFRQTNLLKEGNPRDPKFLHKDPSAYDHLKIICYGTDKEQTHSAYELNMEDKSMDVSKSKVTSNGDGTLFTSNWQTVPGGLKGDIVMAEEGSNHVSLVNDKRLHDVLLDTFFDGDELKKASATSLLK